jgi:hypothetical protein
MVNGGIKFYLVNEDTEITKDFPGKTDKFLGTIGHIEGLTSDEFGKPMSTNNLGISTPKDHGIVLESLENIRFSAPEGSVYNKTNKFVIWG